MLKTVIHIHTHYSHDSNRTPAQLLDTAREQGVDAIAVTDHDEIEGAFEAARIAADQTRAGRRPVRVIVGQEISTADGHVIGLFLSRRIEPGQSCLRTAERIHEQGGLVLAPHPFLTFDSCSLLDNIFKLRPLLHAVEICNAQNPLWWQCRKAARFARRHGLTSYVGADAHLHGALDACYQIVPDFYDAPSFLHALRHATLYPGRFGALYLATMVGLTVWQKVTGRSVPGFGTALRTPRTAFDPAAPG